MNLPEEIVYKILSYLPRTVLEQLKLTNKQYWNIYRENNTSLWHADVDWLEKINCVPKMTLENELYIASFGGLQYRSDRFSFDNKVELTFSSDTKLGVYLWTPEDSEQNFENKPAYFMRTSRITHISDRQVIGLFQKYLQKYINPSLYEINEDSLKIPSSFVTFYLKQSPNLEKEKIEFTDKIRVNGFIIWIVVIETLDQERTEIGRAVCAHQIYQKLKCDQLKFIDDQKRVYISEDKLFHGIKHSFITNKDSNK